ncbi:MAG: GNAT family N-acetyltransferase, partial [Actinomycetota bacterium]
MEIRPVRPDESDEAGRITALAYEDFGDRASASVDYLDRIADVRTRAAHAVVLGAFDGDRVLGTVTLELTDRIPGGHPRPPLRPDQAHVRMLGVGPHMQRRGTSRRLMEAAVAEARRAGKRRITLETTESMLAAQRLYESMGFRRARTSCSTTVSSCARTSSRCRRSGRLSSDDLARGEHHAVGGLRLDRPSLELLEVQVCVQPPALQELGVASSLDD